jgi:hypothetical protein
MDQQQFYRINMTNYIYEGNSVTISHVVTNPLSEASFVNDATVSVTILDKNSDPLPDVNWPISLTYQSASNGLYLASILSLPSIKANKVYYIQIDVLGLDNLIGKCVTEVLGAIKKGSI